MKTCASFLSVLLILAGCPAWADGELVTGPDRRHEIDARIDALDAERGEISMTGPKTATFIGLGMVLAGGAQMGAGFNHCSKFDDRDCALGVIISGGAFLLIGGIAALTGGILWNEREARRNEIDAERESLIEERDGLPAALSRLQLNGAYRDDTHFVTLGVRF